MQQKKETVFHVEQNGTHQYFGSISAICANMKLNIKKETLWNYKIRPSRPYYGRGFTIRKGSIIRKKSSL